MSPTAGQKYPADQQIALYYSGGGIAGADADRRPDLHR